MARERHPAAVVELPNSLEIVITRAFNAPIGLVFDTWTKVDRAELALAEGEKVKVFAVDLRVGGNYHTVFVGNDGTEASFRGTFLAVERPTRIVATWHYNGWPDAEAVESIELHEVHAGTTLTYRLAFRDQLGRDHMTDYGGLLANIDNMEGHLLSLLDPPGTSE